MRKPTKILTGRHFHGDKYSYLDVDKYNQATPQAKKIKYIDKEFDNLLILVKNLESDNIVIIKEKEDLLIKEIRILIRNPKCIVYTKQTIDLFEKFYNHKETLLRFWEKIERIIIDFIFDKRFQEFFLNGKEVDKFLRTFSTPSIETAISCLFISNN